MLSGLLIILLPLFIGYLIKLNNRPLLQLANRLLSAMVYVILFLMGVSLAMLDNIGENLFSILAYASVFFICTFGANLLFLWLLDKKDPWHVPAHKQAKPPSRIKMVLESLQLCGVVVVGFFCRFNRMVNFWLCISSQPRRTYLFIMACWSTIT